MAGGKLILYSVYNLGKKRVKLTLGQSYVLMTGSLGENEDANLIPFSLVFPLAHMETRE